jgi:hypothetical protein
MVMPKVGWNALALGALVAVSAGVGGGAGCSGTKPTELVPGVTTQIVVPHDLQGVRVTVLADGALVFDQGYNVGPGGTVQLPSTLGVLSSPNPSTVVSVTIRGYQSPCVGTGNAVAPDCSSLGDAPVGNGGPQVLRRSVQTFVDQRILFVPMPLSYSCWNNGGCTSDQSCKGNQCVPSTTDSANLVDFDPALLDGTDVCFNPQECFADALPAQLVDLATCTYAVPTIPGTTPPPGLNVRIWYEDFLWTPDGDGTFSNVLQNGGEMEILNNDPTEGFTLGGPPDAGVGDGGASTQELFQLAPGLCQLAQQAALPPPPPAVGADGGVAADAGTGEYVTVSRIEVATGCPSKPALLPICQGQQANASVLPGDAGSSPDGVCNVNVNMTPTQSALYLAFDDSQLMNGAYGGMGSAYALSLSLNDPVFQRTYAASTFFHQTTSADCTATPTSYESPKVPFGLAASVQSKIANELLTWTAPDPGTMSCSTTGGIDGGSTCPSGQVCAGTGTPNMFTCVTPDALDLQAALRLDSGVYGDILQFLQGRGSVNVAAAMFFLNRAPTASNDCNPPLPAPDGGVDTTVTQAIENEIAAAFNATPSLRTYFIVLDDDAHDTHNVNPPGALTYFNTIQSDLPQAVTVLDATNTSTMSQAQIVGANFSKIVTQLGTCVYDYGLAAGYAADQVEIGYQIPGQPKTIIPQDPNCDDANQETVSGWNFDGGRVRICGQACSTLQSSILGATAAALNANLPAPDIGVTATVLCAPATGEVSDAAPVDAGPASDGSGAAIANCALTCVGCCDSFGNCLTGTTSLACGTGGQLCQTCNGPSTCDDAGVCEGTGSSDGASDGTAVGSSGSDAASSSVSSDSGG